MYFCAEDYLSWTNMCSEKKKKNQEKRRFFCRQFSEKFVRALLDEISPWEQGAVGKSGVEVVPANKAG